jgi:ADP-heptose:LPS heptosyltransferase
MGWGDDLMVLGEAQAKAAELGGPVEIVDAAGQKVTSPLFINQPCFAQHGQQPVATLALGPGKRPYMANGGGRRRVWKRYQPKAAKINWLEEELAWIESLPNDYVVIEPTIKKRSGMANKTWGFDRYQQVVKKLNQIKWVQLVQDDTTPRLDGVQHIRTFSFRSAMATLSRAIGYLGPEGGLHHASAAVGVPAVVIFGGYISPEVTGYEGHINLFTGTGLGCGNADQCECRCIASITVGQVCEAVEKLLARQTDTAHAHLPGA